MGSSGLFHLYHSIFFLLNWFIGSKMFLLTKKKMYSQDSLFSSKTDFAKGTHSISSNFRGNELIHTNL